MAVIEIERTLQQLIVPDASAVVATRGAWMGVDLRAIAHNVSTLRHWLPERTRLMAVVKADGYGHGAMAVAQTALLAGADWLGVATVAEGLRLRGLGFNQPMMLLGLLTPAAYPAAIEANLDVTVGSAAALTQLSRTASQMGRIARVHLKLDTGMTRVGEPIAKADELVTIALSSSHLELVGIESHLATAEDPDARFAREQLRRFSDAASRPEIPSSVIRHVANSAATVFYPEAHWDMVRPGLLLYGIPPRPGATIPISLRRAMTINAYITQLREVGPGVAVGYGGSFVTTRKTKLALLPVGYADGLPRALSNKQRVLVGGIRCPIAGNISMDQCAVDVTDADPNLGDEVVFLGPQGKDEVLVEEWADAAGTIPYEIICGLGHRLPRLYHK
ncbi:Alanine racemase [compost metagenome]